MLQKKISHNLSLDSLTTKRKDHRNQYDGHDHYYNKLVTPPFDMIFIEIKC